MYKYKGLSEYSEEQLHGKLTKISEYLNNNIQMLEQTCENAESLNKLTYILASKRIVEFKETLNILNNLNITKEWANKMTTAQSLENTK